MCLMMLTTDGYITGQTIKINGGWYMSREGGHTT